MLSINKYYKAKVDGQMDYRLSEVNMQFPDDVNLNVDVPEGSGDADELASGNKNNVVIARYVGYSTSEDQDVYEVTCVGGSKFLTDYDGADDLLRNGITEYVKTILSNQNRAFVNSDYDFFANPMQVASIVQTKDGYDNISDAEEDEDSVSCYVVTMTTGESFITNLSGINNLDDNWC